MIHDGDTAHGESVSSDTARESRGFLAAGPGERGGGAAQIRLLASGRRLDFLRVLANPRGFLA